MAPTRGARSFMRACNKSAGTQTETWRDLFELLYCDDDMDNSIGIEAAEYINPGIYDVSPYLSQDSDFNHVKSAKHTLYRPIRMTPEPRSKILQYFSIFISLIILTLFICWLLDI
ncbi:uncharacterized protein LOC111594921 [Drosophila hydei]|uniref:Uncharacterized protein LOC111594921 n=1 Tax=Drosophila hydei TaxID=7224 RepID=A0A6J1LHZ0_DROHY|nr:uncharacterized protein LOC111594921 [Drosophila hydei]